MTQRIIPVVMAGGKGTRLWPLSRTTAPKQFINVTDDKTLFQKTLERVADAAIYDAPVIITNQDSRFVVAEQAREIDVILSAVLLEPVARNTAAAIAAAAIYLCRRFGEDAILQFLASDQEISAGSAYQEAIAIARETAAADRIVTFGISPTEPATGYGYIEQGTALPTGAFRVKRFVEKPQLAAAQTMLDCGGFLWNSGIFMCRAGLLLNELKAFAGEVYEAAEAAVDHSISNVDFVRLDPEYFGNSPDISFDYAVMEKTGNAAVVAASFAWSDLGSWDAVWKTRQKDENGNVVIGHATVVDTKNSLILSHSKHLAVQGLESIAVVASEDAVYLGHLDEAQKVGALVKLLAANDITSSLTERHLTSYHPWGGCTSLLLGSTFHVRHLSVFPGKVLSPPPHCHQSEHWICVRGTAKVVIGQTVTFVHENQSIDIPPQKEYCLHNPGKIALEIIEIQTD